MYTDFPLQLQLNLFQTIQSCFFSSFPYKKIMYKKFSLEELTSIQNDFIPHLYKIIQHERCQGVNDFFKIAFREGNELFYFERSSITFKISLEGNTIHMMDEVEKIEVQMPMDQKGGLQDLIKRYIIKKQRQV
jgi:hypothetical protein